MTALVIVLSAWLWFNGAFITALWLRGKVRRPAQVVTALAWPVALPVVMVALACAG